MFLTLQIEDLLKENDQHLRRIMSKVNHMVVQVGFISDTPNKMKASCQSTENPSVNSSLMCTSRIYSPSKSLQIESVDVPSKLLGRNLDVPYTRCSHPEAETANFAHILLVLESITKYIHKCNIANSTIVNFT